LAFFAGRDFFNFFIESSSNVQFNGAYNKRNPLKTQELVMMYVFLIFSLALWAQTPTPQRVDALPNPQKVEDFDHQNKGCPENSECDVAMGKMLARWKLLLDKLTTLKEKEKIPSFIEEFRQKFGLPVEFYTYQNSQLGFKPALFSSPCKEHQAKDPSQRTLKGIAFLKGLEKDKAIIWREDAQIEVPTTQSLVVPQPVMILNGPNPTTFYLPIGDQPLFIKDKSLVVLREDEGIFYGLSVAVNGVWKVIPLDLKNLSTWEDQRETVQCPILALEKKAPQPKEFNIEFCKTVWDEDQKKIVIVKMFQGCSI
jgi:hypothetical protein